MTERGSSTWPWARLVNRSLWVVYKGTRPDGRPQWVGYIGRENGSYHTCHGGTFGSLAAAVDYVGFWGCPPGGGRG